MASFCSKCGSELSADTKFCQSCGTPKGVVSEPVAEGAAVPAAAAAPVVTAPSSNAIKVILIVVGAVVVLGVLSAAAVMFGLWRVSKSVNVDRSGRVTITTPGGKISSGQTPAKLSESEVGAPIYPGAISAEGGFKFGAANGSMATYAFKSPDSVQQVLAFYRDKFGPKTSVVETSDGALVTAAKNDNEGIMVTIGRDESDGKTSITITHTTSTRAE